MSMTVTRLKILRAGLGEPSFDQNDDVAGHSAGIKEQQSVLGSELQSVQAAIIESLLQAQSQQFEQMKSYVQKEIGETNKRLDHFVSDLIITPSIGGTVG